MNTLAHQTQLMALLPEGTAWPRDHDGPLAQLMGGLAEEFARIDNRADAIAAEALPSAIKELIDEWEAEYGLTDNSHLTRSERHAAVVQKYQQYGSQSRQFLQAVATALGIDISITEYRESRFGGNFGNDFCGTDWAFVVQANITQGSIHSSAIGRLETALRQLLHAHKVLISYRSYSAQHPDGDLQVGNSSQLKIIPVATAA